MKKQIDEYSPVHVWGLPLWPFTIEESLKRIDELIREGKPNYFITANVHYAMLTSQDERLRAINAQAAFILADGMPLVWASRALRQPLPERVAGSDLIWKICEQASHRGHRLFLLGGAPGVAERAAINLTKLYPGLTIVGTHSPPFRKLSDREEHDLLERIMSTRPDILFVAFGQPKGELWIARNFEKMNIPVCVQVGASLDFVAGMVHRAPVWMQKTGLEWLYRLLQEPRRLLSRYIMNMVFTVRMLAGSTRCLHPQWHQLRGTDRGPASHPSGTQEAIKVVETA